MRFVREPTPRLLEQCFTGRLLYVHCMDHVMGLRPVSLLSSKIRWKTVVFYQFISVVRKYCLNEDTVLLFHRLKFIVYLWGEGICCFQHLVSALLFLHFPFHWCHNRDGADSRSKQTEDDVLEQLVECNGKTIERSQIRDERSSVVLVIDYLRHKKMYQLHCSKHCFPAPVVALLLHCDVVGCIRPRSPERQLSFLQKWATVLLSDCQSVNRLA